MSYNVIESYSDIYESLYDEDTPEEEINEAEKLIKLIKKCNARGGTDNSSIAYLVKENGEV
mgnify:CR=1 FL=1